MLRMTTYPFGYILTLIRVGFHFQLIKNSRKLDIYASDIMAFLIS